MEISMLDVGGIGGIAAGIVAIGYAVINAFDVNGRKLEDKKNRVSVELVDLLQKTVGELKAQVSELEKKHDQNEKDINRLSAINETLTKVLQGRDEASIKFQQEGFASFKRMKDVHEDIRRLVEIMEQHITGGTQDEDVPTIEE